MKQLKDKKEKMKLKALERFRRDIRQIQPVVVCMKCGSTKVDQWSRTKLQCCMCRNSITWDASSFTIARNGHEVDVANGLMDADQKPCVSGIPAVIDSLLSAAHRLQESLLSPYAGSADKVTPSAHRRVCRLLEQVKDTLDSELAKTD